MKSRFHLLFSAYRPQVLLQSLKSFSSTSTTKAIWNSKTNVIITNPTLLIMESCTTMLELKQIQAQMTCTGLITHTFPLSRILAFCALADGGDIQYARLLFTQIEKSNTYMWNTMIRGYCKAQIPTIGFSFFGQMVRQRIEMDSRSFIFALKACEQFTRILEGHSVHCLIWKMGFDSDLLVRNGLVHYYAEGGFLSLARKVFDESFVRDVVTWTTMIDGYATCTCSDEAMKLFGSMLVSDVEPNEVTMIAVLSACSDKGNVGVGKTIHEYVQKKNVNCSLNLLNALLDMYVKCGCLTAAIETFDNMKVKDVFSWTSMVNGYAKLGDLDSARKFFNDMPERNVVSWNAMIAGYTQNNRPSEALKLFHEMVETGLVPTENSLVCVLSACGQLGCLDLGQWIHQRYLNRRRIQPSTILGNALMDMYAKCGSINSATELFGEMPERNLVSWNTMIAGYAGHAKQALTLFNQMKTMGLKPDHITFVAVLSACSHGGLVSQGREHFESMARDYDVEPKEEHYACMIDLLGRVGRLEEAYQLINKMPMEARVSAWGALLNACKIHGNVELAKLSAEKLLELDPEDSGIYVLLANLYANKKRWDEVRIVRSLMKERGVKKNPGHSLIEVEVCPLDFKQPTEVIKECRNVAAPSPSCCSSLNVYIAGIQKQMLITNRQAIVCATMFGSMLRKGGFMSNIYELCDVDLKDFSIQAYGQQGCLLQSLPSDMIFDNSTGYSFTCDLSDNIAAPWPSSSSISSFSLCGPEMSLPALPSETSKNPGCRGGRVEFLILIVSFFIFSTLLY